MESMHSIDSIVHVLEGTQPSRPSWSRRGFVMTSLATGFALAVQPISAETITTDTNGLAAGEVKVPVKGATLDDLEICRDLPRQSGLQDSLLEGNGFELTVPRQPTPRPAGARSAPWRCRRDQHRSGTIKVGKQAL